MDSNSLTKAQAAKINHSIRPSLNYLFRLRRRMEETGFPPRDSLMQRVYAAYDAVHALSVTVHYLSCDGAGRRS